jgi:hypothetical protein
MLPVEVAMSGYHPNNGGAGFQVSYLVEGRDILRFDSLTVTAIRTPEGIDISRHPSGEPAYRIGPFARTSADGRYCIFSILVPQNQFGEVERLSISGCVTVLLATKRAESRIDLTPADKEAKRVGPFSIQVKPGGMGGVVSTLVPLPMVAPNAIGQPAAAGSLMPAPVPPPALAPNTNAQPATSGSLTPVQSDPFQPGPSESLNVEITGPIKSLIDVKFMDGDDTLQPPSSWDDTRRTYTLPKPKIGRIALTMTYAVELQEAKLPFGQ